MENKKEIAVIIKKYGVDFKSEGSAYTLSAGEVANCLQNANMNGGVKYQIGYSERNHEDGWVIKGCVQEDWAYWVNEFEAEHPIYGMVFGNFESEVYATSEEGYKHFFENHGPESWWYEDI